MKKYVLNYYPIFKCIAGECKHTCCASWEMNIDKQSLNAYKTNKSNFCLTLKKGVNFRKASFKTDKKGRCAFLNQNGLCEIILNLGEKSLCQVCRDHPRFRSFFNDRTEIGLDFCCEEACRMILSFKDKIYPTFESEDGEIKELDFNQINVLEFREKVLEVIQDREQDVNQRIDKVLLLCNAQMLSEDLGNILKKFLSFERLDKKWTSRLKNVKKNAFITTTEASLSHYAEQFLVNSIYRNLYDAEDTYEVRARTIACVIGWWIINNVFERERENGNNNFDLIVDIVRAYSAEVEYSQKNLDKLFSFAYKFIKI